MRLLQVPYFLLLLLPVCLLAQAPTVGVIEIYGARNVSPVDIRKALGMSEGATLPASKVAVEERIEEIDGVLAAQMEAACCEAGKVILYVGIEEKGGLRFEHRLPPSGESVLPDDVLSAYRAFLEAARDASRTGKTAEDLTRGHSLLVHPAAREAQLRFVALANTHRDLLRLVLRDSENEEHRAIAAYMIGYSDKKSEIVDDVQYALQDSDTTVRANAIRALAALAVYASRNPDSGVKVQPTWLIEMLNAVGWTDRNNSAVALVNLTESRDPRVLEQLKERALPALVEMASWQHLPHALPAYILLGRALNIPEQEVQDAWSNDQRDQIIRRASSNKK